jgi:hypothetical protein
MSSKYFYALLNRNDILRSIAVLCFTIRMFLINHFYSSKSIGVDDEYVLENDDGFERDVSPTIHKL